MPGQALLDKDAAFVDVGKFYDMYDDDVTVQPLAIIEVSLSLHLCYSLIYIKLFQAGFQLSFSAGCQQEPPQAAQVEALTQKLETSQVRQPILESAKPATDQGDPSLWTAAYARARSAPAPTTAATGGTQLDAKGLQVCSCALHNYLPQLEWVTQLPYPD